MPDIDKRVACDHHVRAELLSHAAFLTALHQVVCQDSDAALRTRTKFGQVFWKVVQALQILHDYALNTQIVAPHLLDDCRVMNTLDPDTAGESNLGLDVVDLARARCRQILRGLFRLCFRAHQSHRFAVDEKTALVHGKQPRLAVAVLQPDAPAVESFLQPDNCTDESVIGRLDDNTIFCCHLACWLRDTTAVATCASEHVLSAVRVLKAHEY